MDISEIKRIVKLMEEKGLTEFSMKDANGELLLKRGGGDPQVVYSAPPAVAAAPAAAAPAAATPADVAAPAAAPSNLLEITSPMVGTFYRKPAPDKPAHVNEGDSVSESSTVCIVEAMKVMNEIAAEVSGTIVEVLVEDGAPVQFGQPLFTVEPK